MKTLGSRIRAARKNEGITQERLRIATGLSKGFVSDLENDKRNPSAVTLCALSDRLNVSVEWLVRGKHQTVKCPLCHGKGKVEF